MKSQSNLLENATTVDQSAIFENAISIEKLEERLETAETCANIMLF